MTQSTGEDLLREFAPQVLGALLRRYRDFDCAEDAVQEALLAATRQWPAEGVPDNPRGWLVQVATRRLMNIWRGDEARRRRENVAAAQEPLATPAVDDIVVGSGTNHGDDTLRLLLLCCHPSLTPASAVALTLRAVGGLTTAEIANAFLVPETTMAQRISRAKQRIVASGLPFRMPMNGSGVSAWRQCCACCISSSVRGTPAVRARNSCEPISRRRQSG